MIDVRRILAAQIAAKVSEDVSSRDLSSLSDEERSAALVAVCEDAMRLAEASGRLRELLDAHVPLPASSVALFAREREKLRRSRT